MEELDSFKSEILKDFQESSDLTYHKVEDLSAQMHKIQNERQEQKTHIISLEQEIRERYRNLEKRHEESFEQLQIALEASREDNKVLFEKLKVVINNNSAQLELLSKDNNKIHAELAEARSKTLADSISFKTFQKKILELEDTLRTTRQELSEKIAETTEHGNFIRQTKSDMQAILKIQAEMNKKMEETNMRVFEKVDSTKALNDHKLSEVNRMIVQLREEVQENLEELAQIHKDSSTQIILDFEKAITSLNSDTKVIFKKFGSVEENLIKIRDELSIMVTEQHHILIRKNDHIEKALHEICRKMNIPNPLIGY